MGLTKMESYITHNCVGIHQVCPPKAKPRPQTNISAEQTGMIASSNEFILRIQELTKITAFSKTHRKSLISHRIPLFFINQSCWVHATLMVFVNHAQKLKWPAKRESYSKADCRHLNPDAKSLREKKYPRILKKSSLVFHA